MIDNITINDTFKNITYLDIIDNFENIFYIYFRL